MARSAMGRSPRDYPAKSGARMCPVRQSKAQVQEFINSHYLDPSPEVVDASGTTVAVLHDPEPPFLVSVRY